MITEAGRPSDADTSTKSSRAPQTQQQRPMALLLAAFAIVALSTVGFLMLFAMDTTGLDDSSSDLSSSSDYLLPGGQSASDGPVRIKYQGPDGFVSLRNGGIIPLTEDLLLAVSVSPYPPTSFDVAVDLSLTTVEGVPVDDATISADWDMVFMWHGPFETEFSSIGAGHYAAPFDFFMFGPWELVTSFTTPAYDQPDDLSLSIYVFPE